MPNAGAEPTKSSGNGAPANRSGAVRVPKTAELVAAQLRRRIVRGELSEGDALPARRC
jgi:DNA-binding GntR family transcriptional regulator